ncbi:MAG: hypothetical protein DWI00_04540 [Planctomycetota bacterium]|nr:MAG: hypothetical protein DWI00_04540 [Planctomycetota bacterium]
MFSKVGILMTSPAQTCSNDQPLQSVRGFAHRGLLLVITLGVVLSWTQSASASCGDYLFRNGKPVAGHAMPEHQIVQDASFDFGELASPEVPVQAPVRRCSGPNCSSSPVPLAPVPAVPVNLLRSLDPAALLELASVTSETRRAMELPESERGARYLPSSIFRPPAA